jgi:hypothetical protein
METLQLCMTEPSRDRPLAGYTADVVAVLAD